MIIHENDTVLLAGSAVFEATGIESSVALEIGYSGDPTATMFSEAEIIADVASFTLNGHRHYFVGTYYKSMYIAPVLREQKSTYSINLKDEVVRAHSLIYPEGPLEDVTIFGRISFNTTIGDSIGSHDRKQYIAVQLHAIGKLSHIIADVTCPENAEFTYGKIDDRDVRKLSPNRVNEIVEVAPPEKIDQRMYLEWELPVEKHWSETYPYNIILSGATGLIGGLVVKYVTDLIRSNRQNKILIRNLIIELEMNAKALNEKRPLTREIYEKSIADIHFRHYMTVETITRTYQEIERVTNIRVSALKDEEIDALRSEIQHAISQLQKET